jgi:hypothetical protein
LAIAYGLLLGSLDLAHAYTNTTANHTIRIATDKQLYSGLSQATVLLDLTNTDATTRTIDLATFHTNLTHVDVREIRRKRTVNVNVSDFQPVPKQVVLEDGTVVNGTVYEVVGSHLEKREVWDDLTWDAGFVNAYKESAEPSLLNLHSTSDSLHESLVPSTDSTGRPLAEKGRLYGLSLAPGETKTFQLQLTFPLGSSGEFLIEAYDQATGENLGLLDPWWNSSWNLSRQIDVANNDASETLEAGYTVNVTFDHASLVSAGKSNADGSDVRIAWWNASEERYVEIDRVNLTAWNTASTVVAFKLQADIAPSTTDSLNYRLYYDNPGAGTPPTDRNDVFQYHPPLANLSGLWFAERADNASVLEDTSGNGNNGSIVGAMWASGKFGGGLQFDGADDYVDVGTDASLDITGEITLSVWVNANEWEAYDTLLQKGGSGGGEAYLIRHTGGRVSVLYGFNDTTIVESGYIWSSTNSWHHLASTFNGTAALLYIDGVMVEDFSPASPKTLDSRPSDPLYIGFRQNGGANDYFNGTLDSVAIYDRALTADEIAALFIATDPTTSLQGEQNRSDANPPYTQTYNVPPNVSKLIWSVAWGMLVTDGTTGVMNLSLTDPFNNTYSEFSSGVETSVLEIRNLNVTLPVIDYDLGYYAEVRRVTVSNPIAGLWELRATQDGNVLDFETRVQVNSAS